MIDLKTLLKIYAEEGIILEHGFRSPSDDKNRPDFPFYVYLMGGSDFDYADNKVQNKVREITIEIYYKNFTERLFNDFEAVLDNVDISYSNPVSDAWIPEEKCYQAVYYLEVLA